MDNAYLAHVLVRYIVAILAGALALGLSAHASRQRCFGLGCLAGWVACAALSALIFGLKSSGLIARPWPAVLVGLTNTLAGPLLLAYVLHALHQRKLHWAAYLPFQLNLLAVLLFGDALGLWMIVVGTILVDFAYTAAAWVLYIRAKNSVEPRRPILPVLGVLIAISTFHLGQIAMITEMGGKLLAYDVPFLVIGTWLVIAIYIALIGSPTLRAFVPALAPVADAGDRALLTRIDLVMLEQRPWTDPELEVGKLAALLETNTNAVSRALSRAGNTNFYDYVNSYRAEEAERLLLDPEEARIKIEALGRQAGFRARSTFFKVFRARTGLAPAEFRRTRNPAAAD